MNLIPPQRLSLVVCVALPLCSVVAVRWLVPSAGPASAGASVTAPAVPPIEAPTVREPGDSPELVRAVRTLLEMPTGPTTVAATRAHIEVKPTPTARPVARPRPTFMLTSVSRGGRQNVAVIDGKLRRTGDELGEGWTVASIDAAQGEVRLAGPEGDTMSLSLRRDR